MSYRSTITTSVFLIEGWIKIYAITLLYGFLMMRLPALAVIWADRRTSIGIPVGILRIIERHSIATNAWWISWLGTEKSNQRGFQEGKAALYAQNTDLIQSVSAEPLVPIHIMQDLLSVVKAIIVGLTLSLSFNSAGICPNLIIDWCRSGYFSLLWNSGLDLSLCKTCNDATIWML